MTEIDFINSNRYLESINRPGTINFNITPERRQAEVEAEDSRGNPTTENTPKWEITSIAITEEAVNQAVPNLRNVLQQVERVKFIITNSPISLLQDPLPLEVEVRTRAYFPQLTQHQGNTNPQAFYYFGIEPITIRNNDPETPELDTGYNANLRFALQLGNESVDEAYEQEFDIRENRLVTLTPYISDLTFSFSEYNATISNALESRRSSRRVESDRGVLDVNPSNIAAIISGNAKPAQIQESYYSDTGWSRSRFRGTKERALRETGVPSSLLGRSFKGEEFTNDSRIGTICTFPTESRILSEYLWTGESELPKVEFVEFEALSGEGKTSTIGTITTSTMNGLDNISNITLNVSNTPIGLRPGSRDYLRIGEEVVQVVRVLNTTSGSRILRVLRGVGNTEKTDGEVLGKKIQKIKTGNKIFKFTDAITKVELVSNRRVWVQEDNKVLIVNPFGEILKEERCED